MESIVMGLASILASTLPERKTHSHLFLSGRTKVGWKNVYKLQNRSHIYQH